MTLTRRDLDTRLAQIESALVHLSVQIPGLIADVRALRAAALPQTSLLESGEELPEQPEGGQP